MFGSFDIIRGARNIIFGAFSIIRGGVAHVQHYIR